ncbi:MAG: hypothetical protein GPJ54_19120 [Candidatus Heimdallarchaeota archaeon]|nr:hypothetical protein [Candidatus Heimdallarchaeota archaeon]
MSPSRLVERSRMVRAKKISKSSIKEFEVINEDPLIAYLIIQGSSSSPYIVIIDFKKNHAAHSCPDFNRRRSFCKHFGKLFLLLPDYLFGKVVQNQSRLNKIYGGVDKLLNEIKSKKMEEKIDNNEIELEDLSLIESIKAYYTGKRNEPLLQAIKQLIDIELKTDKPYLFFLKLNNILEIPDSLSKEDFRGKISSHIKEKFLKNVITVYSKINSTNLIKQLELAYFISDIAKQLEYNLPFIDINTSSVKIRELSNFIAMTEILYRFQPEMIDQIKQTVPNNFDYEAEVSEAFNRIKRKINFTGTSLGKLNNWISKKQKDMTNYSFSIDYIDEFLVYCIQSNNEKVKYKLSLYKELAHPSTKLLEANPAVRFVFNEIKESERDYVTRNEFTRHRKFFKWLETGKISGKWVERTRQRIPDILLDTDGVIVQWKLNIHQKTTDKYYALDESIKLNLTTDSMQYKQLQPYDYTLSDSKMRFNGEYSKSVTPKHILQPDQVVNLVLQGVKIVSNVLPWDVLSKFSQSGYVKGGDISVAINQCSERSFVYGSLALQNALENILKLGRIGISEDVYEEIHKILKTDTGRLNSISRPLVKRIVIAEGEYFENLFSLIDFSQDNIQLLVVKSAKTNPTLVKFRNKLIKEVLRVSKQKEEIWGKIFSSINNMDLGHYLAFKSEFRSTIIKETKKLNSLISKKPISEKTIYRNFMGKIVCDNLGFSPKSQFGDYEVKEIAKIISNII